MTSTKSIGVVFGRFQPFHNGHVEHILTPLKECDFVYIGITNPDPQLTGNEAEDTKRSEKHANPFTYFHRLTMIRNVINDLDINPQTYAIIPFPINHPELILNYAPANAMYYVTILTNDTNDWNRKKMQILSELHLKVETIESDRKISSTQIREMIKNQENWQRYVPMAVSRYLNTLDLQEMFPA